MNVAPGNLNDSSYLPVVVRWSKYHHKYHYPLVQSGCGVAARNTSASSSAVSTMSCRGSSSRPTCLSASRGRNIRQESSNSNPQFGRAGPVPLKQLTRCVSKPADCIVGAALDSLHKSGGNWKQLQANFIPGRNTRRRCASRRQHHELTEVFYSCEARMLNSWRLVHMGLEDEPF